ncbi:MAG: DNA repair protein RecO [Melioribacteraceae bacterium]|nr:DNA repair protein RecO [Melioribacteraceae bacterium]MCO6472625.1 DNA repair protein RecO [Melioribacteraceae bacterium]MDD3557867.1 DNA repair protein RecO [Melioribacteraceae bacterium]
MSEIIKTRALVLSKLNYGETSKIVAFYTEDNGKFTGIIKGARSPKSKIGKAADVLNLVEIQYYQKENREIQLVSGVEILNYFPKIKSDLDKLKYASTIIEPLIYLTVEHEVNEKLFRGVIKILELMNDSADDLKVLAIKFLNFFIKELGFELKFDSCSLCGTEINQNEDLAYDFSHGLLCPDCSHNSKGNYFIQKELLKILYCIKHRKSFKYNDSDLIKLIKFFERFLMFQFSEFKGFRTLNMI